MSDTGSTQGMWEEIASGTSAWSGPNERTAAVDGALVRVARAMDSAALHHDGRRPRRIELNVDSAAHSQLEFEIRHDGRWTFEDGSWVDEGRAHRARLLRPVIRGVARATRPDFAAALDALVRDVEVACAERIAVDGEQDPDAGTMVGQSVVQLLESSFPGLSAQDRGALQRVTSAVDLGAGTTMIVEGTMGDDVLFLLAGKIAVDAPGGTVRLGPGSVVGERGPMTGAPRDATVRAVTDVVVLVLHARDLATLPAAVVDALGTKVRI